MSENPAQGSTLGGAPELNHGKKLQDVTDDLIGTPGTPARDEYEDLLQRKLVSAKLREYRKLHHLTQEELGERIGVQKNQISKLERDSTNITLGTLFKVFRALGIGVKLEFKAPPKSTATKLARLAMFALAFVLTHTKPNPANSSGVWFLIRKIINKIKKCGQSVSIHWTARQSVDIIPFTLSHEITRTCVPCVR